MRSVTLALALALLPLTAGAQGYVYQGSDGHRYPSAVPNSPAVQAPPPTLTCQDFIYDLNHNGSMNLYSVRIVDSLAAIYGTNSAGGSRADDRQINFVVNGTKTMCAANPAYTFDEAVLTTTHGLQILQSSHAPKVNDRATRQQACRDFVDQMWLHAQTNRRGPSSCAQSFDCSDNEMHKYDECNAVQ